MRVAVAGYHGEPTGYGEVARLLALALEPEYEVVRHHFYDDSRLPPVDVVLLVGPAEEFWRCQVPGSLRVGYTMIERDAATPLEGKLLRNVDRVVVPTAWNQEAFRAMGVESWVVPPPLDPEIPSLWNLCRPHPRPNKGWFVFLSVFEWGRPHKDPMALIEAFHMAFPNYEDDRQGFNGAILQLRTTPRLPHDEFWRPGVEIVPPLSREDLLRVQVNADAYVSCHTAEGWGLPLFESVALGVPAVATAYGAPCTYLSAENAVLVAPRGVHGGRAKIDVEGLAMGMRRVYEAGRRPRAYQEERSDPRSGGGAVRASGAAGVKGPRELTEFWRKHELGATLAGLEAVFAGKMPT